MKAAEQISIAQLRVRSWVWAQGVKSRQRPTAAQAFSAAAKRKLLLVSLPDPISQSQVFPFHFYKDTLRRRWQYELREVGLQAMLDNPDCTPRDADVVCFQAWIDKSEQQLKEIVALIRHRHPRATVAFMDPCAPTDLRFAASIGGDVDFYIKKHVLRNRLSYSNPTRGDTNLSDWYGPYYGEDLPQVHFELPTGFLDKLLVGPSFVTAPYMLPRFAAVAKVPSSKRIYEIHARLGGAGAKNWYEKMRADAMARVGRLRDRSVTPQTLVNKRAYMRELSQSRICFSPFGYGEVCWRDYEAAYAGATLLKPDMSHIETFPDVFIAGKTYMPLRWDFSDLGDAVEELLSRESLRRDMAASAYATLHAFARGDQFVDQMEPVLAPGS